jgi:hypothetical protein
MANGLASTNVTSELFIQLPQRTRIRPSASPQQQNIPNLREQAYRIRKMAGSTPQRSRWNITLADKCPVIEGDEARRRQAELSRFQLALPTRACLEGKDITIW